MILYKIDISRQTTGLDHLLAHFHFDWGLYLVSILTVVYPKVVLLVVYILTVVSSLSDSSQQHGPHFYFHAIFISAYSAVRVKIYIYVNMLGINDLLIN